MRKPRQASRRGSRRPASSRRDTFVLEHGYCRSVYVTDPNGLILEFTLDAPQADKINNARRADAHQELKRWLAGDHHSNNTYRHADRQRRACMSSIDRILTTHVGSLPRSQAVTDVMFAREAPMPSATCARMMRSSPRRSPRSCGGSCDVGIDIVSDGEMSKISYATYVADRFSGFDGDTPREPGQDLVEFPALLQQARRARLDRQVPPAALRGTGQASRMLKPLQADIANLKAAGGRRPSRWRPS